METLLLITFVALVVLAILGILLFIANWQLAKFAAKDAILFDNSWKGRLVRTLRDWTSYGVKLTYLICYLMSIFFRFILVSLLESERRYWYYA